MSTPKTLGRLLRFAPRGWREPAPPLVQERLQHEVMKVAEIFEYYASKGTPKPVDALNGESEAFGYLYQHASTKVREELYEYIRLNNCQCFGCAEHRRMGDVEMRAK